MESSAIKSFYTGHADSILAKRFRSPFPVRQYLHRSQYYKILSQVLPEGSILDTGCGEGVIGLLLADKGRASIGVDMSLPNVERARQEALTLGHAALITYVQGDAEHLPFPDKSFDTVISSHVLEHLPNFDQGWHELCRVARKRIIVALPTVPSLCAFALLGGDTCWRPSKRSLYAIPFGFIRYLRHLHDEGVQEGYAGNDELPHIWRHPWIIKQRLQHHDWHLISYQASSLAVPYFTGLLPLARWLEQYSATWPLKYCGYGSTMTFERVDPTKYAIN